MFKNITKSSDHLSRSLYCMRTPVVSYPQELRTV